MKMYHSKKDVCRRVQWFACRGADCGLQQPAELGNDELHDAVEVENWNEKAEEQYNRKHL